MVFGSQNCIAEYSVLIEHPYHMSVKVVSRGKGHNAVAAAAYRSGELLQEISEPDINLDEKSHKSINYDYRRRHGVMSSFIMAPRNAPAWATNRGRIWNKVEESEKRVDAQLAREVVVSLPSVDIFNHLNTENKEKRLQEFYKKILKRYVNDNFIKEGMIADIALHKPSEKNDERNYHAHIMLTMRKIGNDHEFGPKERSWNSPAKLESWRRQWGRVVNDTLKNNKIEAFVDHRSYKERGLDIGATMPRGKVGNQLEKNGVETSVGNENRKVENDNLLGHKYLEKVFEHSPMAPEHEILAAIKRAGYEDERAVKKHLEREGMLIRMRSSETNITTKMFAFEPMKTRAEVMKTRAESLSKRNNFGIPSDVVQSITRKRGDKMVRDALNYTAQGQGFKVIESSNNGHKKTYLSSCREMYKTAGYDVISVARNNTGKDVFKSAGFNKGVLTYRDLLRRFGDRYSGAKSKTQKVIIVDEADQLSPLQDQEIFNTANKIGAKLIYLGSPKANSKRLWHSQFGYYKMLTAYKTLRQKFLNTQKKTQLIREAFTNAQVKEAIMLQQKRSASYVNSYKDAAHAKQGVLDSWFNNMKKKKDRRFILTATDKDAEVFNFAIQQKRLDKKHLSPHQGKIFTVSYQSDQQTTLRRDMFLYWGDQIQFKKSYKNLGIEEGTKATVRIHHSDYSLLELDDGRVIKINLQEHNGFDLGYAGRVVSNTDHNLEQGYLYHSKANALDDAPLLYQMSKQPVKLFYSEGTTSDIDALSSQLLGRRHNLHQGFSEVGQFEDLDDNDILMNEEDNTPEDEANDTNRHS